MGWIVVAAFTSDIRRGSAETAPFSSSLTKPSNSCSSVNQIFVVGKFHRQGFVNFFFRNKK